MRFLSCTGVLLVHLLALGVFLKARFRYGGLTGVWGVFASFDPASVVTLVKRSKEIMIMKSSG